LVMRDPTRSSLERRKERKLSRAKKVARLEKYLEKGKNPHEDDFGNYQGERGGARRVLPK